MHVRHADGTEGWSDEAPFDAILVSAGAPDVPKSLMRQLKIGARMVVPVGSDPRSQELIRITRVDDDEYEREDIADVRFVPLIGKEGWESEDTDWQTKPPRVVQSRPAVSVSLPGLIAKHAEAFTKLEDADLEPLLRSDRRRARRADRRGQPRHIRILPHAGTRSRSGSSKRRASTSLRPRPTGPTPPASTTTCATARCQPSEWTAFARFPTWMWRNEETRASSTGCTRATRRLDYGRRTAFYGLDLYSLYTSVRAVIAYLESVDPDLAAIARQRYGCLSPWEADPAAYGRAALRGAYHKCEQAVAHILTELLQKRQAYALRDGERFFDAAQNARLVANAEQYYRIMYYGSRASWNLRDSHMFETLQEHPEHHGAKSKAVIWAHNSHIGDASATEMGRRGEHNIGQLCREHFGKACYHIGFGTNDGTVAAASGWDEPMQIMDVRSAHPQSYERLFHMTERAGPAAAT